MATMTQSIVVHRPHSEVTQAIADPATVMSAVAQMGRVKRLADGADGAQRWAVFIVIGTMYMGGTVRIDEAANGVLAWHALSGFRHSARFETMPLVDGARLTVTFDFQIGGAITGYLTAQLIRGYVGRTAEAVLEAVRHSIEYPPAR